jgi:hypothetical protein
MGRLAAARPMLLSGSPSAERRHFACGPLAHTHWKSTARPNRETMRRTHVVRFFPNAGTCLRPARMLALEARGPRYFSMQAPSRSTRSSGSRPSPRLPDGGRSGATLRYHEFRAAASTVAVAPRRAGRIQTHHLGSKRASPSGVACEYPQRRESPSPLGRTNQLRTRWSSQTRCCGSPRRPLAHRVQETSSLRARLPESALRAEWPRQKQV